MILGSSREELNGGNATTLNYTSYTYTCTYTYTRTYLWSHRGQANKRGQLVPRPKEAIL